jgi:hypothetical protein
LAVTVNGAAETIIATVADPTAIDVALVSVVNVVVTKGRLADVFGAHAIGAVAWDRAGLLVGTGITGAAAIDIGLVAIAHDVIAGRNAAHGLQADAAIAITGGGTGQTIGAGPAFRAAAIGIGLCTIVHGIVTGGRLAEVLSANPLVAISRDGAALAGDAAITDAAAIDIGLVAVSNTIKTDRDLAGLSNAHSTQAVSGCLTGETIGTGGTIGPTAVDIPFISVARVVSAFRGYAR